MRVRRARRFNLLQFSEKRILIIDVYAQANYNLTTPKAGALNKTIAEGANYKLQDRIANLTDEFQERRG